jgi:hypothetical protein
MLCPLSHFKKTTLHSENILHFLHLINSMDIMLHSDIFWFLFHKMIDVQHMQKKKGHVCRSEFYAHFMLCIILLYV